MVSRAFRLTLVSATAVILIATAAAPAQKTPTVAERFNDLKKRSLEAIRNGTIKIQEVGSGDTRARLATVPRGALSPPTGSAVPADRVGIRIWAELFDGDDAGKMVSLSEHVWKPEERFYLWLESAVPLHCSVFEVFPDKPDQKHRQLIPGEHDFKGIDSVIPGEPYKMPIRLKLDKNASTEHMEILLVADEEGVLAVNEAAKSDDDGGGTVKQFETTRNQLAEIHERGDGNDFKLDRDEDRDIATFFIGPGTRGQQLFSFRKR